MRGMWGMKGISVIGLSFLLFFSVSEAAEYPVKPLTFVVPLEAGSDGDLLARPVVQKASEILGKPIMVVNKPGAGSSLGYRDLYDAKPDGYTIGVAYTSLITNKLQGISPFDYNDFTVMGTFYNWGPIVVGATKSKRPFKTMEEVISYVKSHPGEVSMATSGVGMGWWWATMVLTQVTGLQFNVIPQPGAAGFTISQVAGGHVDLATLGLAAAKAQIDAGNIRFLAAFGSERVRGYEAVPTFKDLGYDVNWEGPSFWVGPPKMPKDIVNKLTDTFEKATNSPEYRKFAMERNATAMYLPPDKAVDFLNRLRSFCVPVAEKAGILKVK
jgi:tripartite-type tricarboxylate transporter receptor subunit TctC